MFFLKTEEQKILFFRDFRQDLILSKCRYFVIENSTLRESQTTLDHLVDAANYPFVKNETFVQTKSVLEGLSSSCRLPNPSGQLQAHFNDRLDYLESISDELFKIWNKNILVVGFKGVRGKFPTKKLSSKAVQWYFNAKNCIFEVRCLIASSAQKKSMKNLSLENFETVVCVFGDGMFWCQLKDVYRKVVLEKFLLKDNHDVLKDSVETVELGIGGPKLFAQTKAQEKIGKCNKKMI